MPNGDPSITAAEWAKIRVFFQKLSAVLQNFASAHNLAMVEYYHESPSWSCRFRHPKGGGATVHLERLDDSNVRINGSWYIDEYETFTRHFKWGPNHDLSLENIDLRKELEARLHEIVSWDKNLLTPHPNYKNVWSGFSKEAWDRIYSTGHLPLLRP